MAKTKMTKRKIQALNTRQKIFDTALQLFNKKGYDRVTVDDVCKKAGISKGTFYNYFKSKDQIIIEEFLKIDHYYQEMLPEINSKESYLERMKTFARLSLKYISEQGAPTVRIAYYSQLSPSIKTSPIVSPKRPLYQMAERLAREAQENGELRGDIPSEEIANTVIRAMRGIIYEWCLHNGKFDLEEAGEELVQILVHGLLP